MILPQKHQLPTLAACWAHDTFGIMTIWSAPDPQYDTLSSHTVASQVTRGARYVSTLKMYSSRTRNTECINSQNPLGFHLADGTTYTYVTGDEYEDIAAAWDWNMIPGTTVDYGAAPLQCDTANQVGVENFVGGVSTGKLGMAVMVCSHIYGVQS